MKNFLMALITLALLWTGASRAQEEVGLKQAPVRAELIPYIESILSLMKTPDAKILLRIRAKMMASGFSKTSVMVRARTPVDEECEGKVCQRIEFMLLESYAKDGVMHNFNLMGDYIIRKDTRQLVEASISNSLMGLKYENPGFNY